MDIPFWDAQMETLPLERRRLLREHRLQWQLRRCWDASPFHRARFEAAGLDTARFAELTDWQRLPVLRPSDLPAHNPANEPDPGLAVAPRQWWHEVDAMPGSPSRVRTDGDTVHRADLAARAMWAAGARPGQPLQIRAARGAEAVDNDGLTEAAIVAGANRIGLRPTPDDGESGASATGSFSVAVANATSPTAGDANGHTRLIWRTAFEPDRVTEPSLTALAVPYLAPTVAYECDARRGLHWADEHLLIEVLDPDTLRAMPVASAGALVVTELAREGSPLLRFWTGLVGLLVEEPCSCGRTSARSPWVRKLA